MKYYIYCFIKKPRHFDLNFFGLNDARIQLVSAGEVSAVVSKAALSDYVATPKNLLAHQQVIEEVMAKHSLVLPVDFGTVLQSGVDLKKFTLIKKQKLILKMLERLEGKEEFDLKVTWLDLSKIFLSLTTSSEKLKLAKNSLFEGRSIDATDAIEIGNLISKNFDRRKEALKNQIITSLNDSVVLAKESPILGDDTFINLSVLVQTKKRNQFASIVRRLSKRLTKEEIVFDCCGPLPPYSFTKTYPLFE